MQRTRRSPCGLGVSLNGKRLWRTCYSSWATSPRSASGFCNGGFLRIIINNGQSRIKKNQTTARRRTCGKFLQYTSEKYFTRRTSSCSPMSAFYCISKSCGEIRHNRKGETKRWPTHTPRGNNRARMKPTITLCSCACPRRYISKCANAPNGKR